MARAIQAVVEKAQVCASQRSEGMCQAGVELGDCRIILRAIWPDARETERGRATASASFGGYRPEPAVAYSIGMPVPQSVAPI